MNITRTSMFTGITRTLDLPITEEQIAAYQNGVHLQDAFPNLSPGDREFIKTGVTDAEWDEMYGEGEEE